MRADVARRLALLVGVEEPLRPDVRRARDDLHQVVHALHVDRWLGLGPRHDLAERRAIVDERALQHRRHFEALGHDVVGDELPRVGLGQRGVDLRQVGGLEDPRLVGEDVEPALDRRQDAIHLHGVPAREHDDVARTLLEHALEVVGARVHLEVPRGRALGAPVESGDAVEVLEEVPAERRVDVDARRHARVHLFLDERGVKVSRVERHQTHVGRRPTLLSAQRAPHGHRDRRATPYGNLVFIVIASASHTGGQFTNRRLDLRIA